jgi:C1A family cysteine protease
MKRRLLYFLLVNIFILNQTTQAEKSTVAGDAFLFQGNNPVTIVLQKAFTATGALTGNTITLDERGVIYGAGLTAQVKLFNDASVARVILVDDFNNEYLVYEAYSLLVDEMAYTLQNRCVETQLLDGVTPVSLRVELLDASMTVQELHVSSASSFTRAEILEQRQQIHAQQERQMIDLINTQIKKKDMLWIAGPTSLSSLTYTQKKMMFEKDGMLANLQGFEYYAGGVFELKSSLPLTPVTTSTAIDSFDWRNRHAANNPKSPYYDQDTLGGGWATSIKDQALPQYCGSCWAHSTCANAEMLANLYFNKHIDLNLAEQELMECSDACSAGKGCSGGWPNKASKWVSTHGIMEEDCFVYKASDAPTCADTCKAPKDNVRYASTISTSGGKMTEDSLKRFIIRNGPVNVAISSMSHAMCLVGFRKVAGKTSWIFKNSHGIKTGIKGYTEVKPSNLSDFSSVDAFKLPISSKLYTDKDIRCVDLDKDGYFNWGIGPKPATCPEGCPAEEDCDDFRNDLGPMQADGSCKPISVHITSGAMIYGEIAFRCKPNPFSRFTAISFPVTGNAKAMVQLFDLSGSNVKTIQVNSVKDGLQSVLWDGTNQRGDALGSGAYLCVIAVADAIGKSTESFMVFLSR